MSFFDGTSGGARARHWRRLAARLGVVWASWTLVGLFFTSQIYFYFASTERPVSFLTALVWQLGAVYMDALLTPFALWLAWRYPLERYRRGRHALVHVAGGTLFAAVLSAGHVCIDTWYLRGQWPASLFSVARSTFANLDKELLVYWLIVLISHAINYYKRYREGELKASQAQLQALKMQLHPHFLFNALHSISTLIYRDPEAADKMIARLGDFLRLTLQSSATQEVLLRQELEFLNCYLEIERIRFSDRLTTRFDVEAQALNCRVPNLILQPIVENAIRHGVSARTGPGHIEIKARRRHHTLRLQVRDNGPGLSAVQHPHNAAAPSGLGLLNTRERLAQLYGGAYRFELAEDPRGGAVVTLEIPFLSSDECAAAEPDPPRRHYAAALND